MTTATHPLHAFPPLVDEHAHTLILGSMPGEASLQAGQYYAHPRNGFWPIVAEVLGFAADLPYPERCAALLARGCALWDVLATCERAGSLDADIRNGTPNNFPAFFADNPRITRVFFNGSTAEGEFRRKVMPRLELGEGRPLTLCRLPSTSPAYAALPRAEKIAQWRAAWESR